MTGPAVKPVKEERSWASRFKLDARELFILERASEGWTYRQIAQELNTSEAYVKTLALDMRNKLGADNIAHAVAIGFRKGLLSLERAEDVRNPGGH